MSVAKYNMHRASDNRGTCASSAKGLHLLFAALLTSLMVGCVSHIRTLMHDKYVDRGMAIVSPWDISRADILPPGAAYGIATSRKATSVADSSLTAEAAAADGGGGSGTDKVMQASPVAISTPAATQLKVAPGSKPTATAAHAAVPSMRPDMDHQRGREIVKQNATTGVAVKRGAPSGVHKVPGVPDFMYRYAEGVPKPPLQLKYPLWWFGPFWSGSGYGSEAATYMLSLLRSGRVQPQGLWLAHHGDDPKEPVIKAMTTSDREELAAMEKMPKLGSRPLGTVVVCHSMPTNWPWPKSLGTPGAMCPPEPGMTGWQYVVGRTMFETDKLPQEFVPRVNALQEVWVPSPWGRDSFIASGVDPRKVRVVPEGINTTQYDPAVYTPLDMAARSELVFGRHWAEKCAQFDRLQLQAQGNASQQDGHPKSKVATAAAAVAAKPAAMATTLKRRPFVFFSCGKWERRKGWEVLLEAYLAEFTANDDVELYIMTKPFGGSGNSFQDKMQEWAKSYVRTTRMNAKRTRSRSLRMLPAGASIGGLLPRGANLQPGRTVGAAAHTSSSDYFWNVLFNQEASINTHATQQPGPPSIFGSSKWKKAASISAVNHQISNVWQQLKVMQQWVCGHIVQLAPQLPVHCWSGAAAQTGCPTAGAGAAVMQQQKSVWRVAAVSVADDHQQQQQRQHSSNRQGGRPAQYKGSRRALLADDAGSSQATPTTGHDIKREVTHQKQQQEPPKASPTKNSGSGSRAPAEDDDDVEEEGEVPEYEETAFTTEELATLYVLHQHVSDEDFPRLYKSSDVFVLPSRGEGWGRPHVEAMSMGLPVIATNWSGSTAFLDETVGYPLPIDGVLPVEMKPDTESSWFKGLKWAQPSVRDLRRIMRAVYNDRHTAKLKGANARKRMVERYSPEVIAEVVLKELLRIEQQLSQ